MTTKEAPQLHHPGESFRNTVKKIQEVTGLDLDHPLRIATGLLFIGGLWGGTVVVANSVSESNTGNSIKPNAAEPVKAPDNLGVTVVITPTATVEPTASDCSRIKTPDANTWMQLIPGPYGAHQEFCPTPIAISLDPNTPKDGYSLLADKMIAGQASKADILKFNAETSKRNVTKNTPQTDELTAMQYVIADANGERMLVDGLVNNKGELQSYWDKNGSFIQVK